MGRVPAGSTVPQEHFFGLESFRFGALEAFGVFGLGIQPL